MDENKGAAETKKKPRGRAAQTVVSDAQRERFFDHLAATCNVKASAAEIEVQPHVLYHLRRSDPVFRAVWAEAVEQGLEMLRTRLIGHAMAGGGEAMGDGDGATTGPIDVNLALRLLAEHRDQRDGARRRSGRRYQLVTPEQTDASIRKKLAAMRLSRAKRT